MVNEACAICQVDFSFLSRIIPTSTIKTSCGHRFHPKCIAPALITDNRCPVCRKEASSGCQSQLVIAAQIYDISTACIQLSPFLPGVGMLTAAYFGKVSVETTGKFLIGMFPGICFMCRPTYLKTMNKIDRIKQKVKSKLQNGELSREELLTHWLTITEKYTKTTKMELQVLSAVIVGGGICTLAPDNRITALVLGTIFSITLPLTLYRLYQDYKVSHVHQN